jgi:hypothetical protein
MKHILSYKDKLYEFQLSTENYSKYYYLVLRFDEKTIQNLVKGKFEGLKGISDSENIINHFFDIRDILLVMKKEAVESLNDLEPIKYDDIEYLSKDNLKILKRLYQIPNDYNNGSLLYQGIRKCEYYKYGEFKNDNYLTTLSRKVNKYYSLFYKFDRDYSHDLNEIKYAKDYNDLLEQTYNIINTKDENYTKEIIDLFLRYIILTFAALFKKEKEVLVKNEVFIIPEKSFLFIKNAYPDSATEYEHNLILDKYIDELKRRYIFKRLPYIKGEIISNTHKPVFAFIRYLDKLSK